MAIRPTFYGFEMAKSALAASQRNIDVTGQNIANINTIGYSRQRVNLSAVGAGGMEWKYPVHPSQNVGFGVNIESITRVRDEFLDIRYRKEFGDNQRFEIIGDSLGQVQTLVDEFVTENLDHIFTSFMDAFQSFQFNADEAEFASLTRSAAQQLTRTLNKIASDMNTITNNAYKQLELVKDSVNNIARSLDDVNKEIRQQFILGPVSNELLDKRDMLIDQLSGFGEVHVVQDESFGLSVYFGKDANLMDNDSLLVEGNQVGHRTLEFDYDTNDITNYNEVRLTWTDGGDFVAHNGQIHAYYEMLNGIGDVSETDDRLDFATKGIPYFMNIINTFTATFAEAFNEINALGGGGELFVASDGGIDITARNITMNEEWIKDEKFMITSTNSSDTGAARNDNILRFIDAIRREDRDMGGFTGSFQQYVGSLNTEISLEVNYNDKRQSMSDILLLSIDDMRESIMGVSEDEEAMNLSRYQKSYNAAARYMTALDEMLDLIVNRLGLVGR